MDNKLNDIEELVDVRNLFLKENDKDERIDLIEQQITTKFIDSYNDYPVDFILETLTSFGQAPNLIYDDNGLFAVSSAGYQPVVMDDERIEGGVTIFVEKEQWFDTIRKALFHYLKS